MTTPGGAAQGFLRCDTGAEPRSLRELPAGALLGAAVEYARANGATLLEAYPADPHGARIPSAQAYQGILSMFLRAAFTVAARRQVDASSAVRPIVRRTLHPPPA